MYGNKVAPLELLAEIRKKTRELQERIAQRGRARLRCFMLPINGANALYTLADPFLSVTLCCPRCFRLSSSHTNVASSL